MLCLVIIFSALISGTNAEYCYGASSYSGGSSSFYCPGYCCGYNDSECCDRTVSPVFITGIIFASLVGFFILVLIILCIVKACTKSGHNGRVIHPQQQHQLFVVNSGFHPFATPPYEAGASYHSGPQHNNGSDLRPFLAQENPTPPLPPAYIPPQGPQTQGQPTQRPPIQGPPIQGPPIQGPPTQGPPIQGPLPSHLGELPAQELGPVAPESTARPVPVQPSSTQ